MRLDLLDWLTIAAYVGIYAVALYPDARRRTRERDDRLRWN